MIVFVNGSSREIPESTRLLEVLPGVGEPGPGQAGAEVPRGVAVALDGSVVPRSRIAATELHEGARVEIVTAVQGG